TTGPTCRSTGSAPTARTEPGPMKKPANRRAFSWRDGLPERQGVAEDQAVLVQVVAEVGAGGGVAPRDAEVLQRAILEHVGDVGVAFPFLAFGQAGTAVDVVAGQVAGHEGQAGNAEGGEVVVVAGLPGLLVLEGEVADLHEVDQEGVGAVDVGEAGVAARSEERRVGNER